MVVENNKLDFIISILALGLSLYVFVASRAFPPQSQFFVNIILAFFFGLSVIYFIQSGWKIIKQRKEDGATREKIQLYNYKVFLTVIGFALYIFVMIPVVGFFPSTVIFAPALTYLLGTRSIPYLVGIAIAFPAVLYVAFVILLRIPLPLGILFS